MRTLMPTVLIAALSMAPLFFSANSDGAEPRVVVQYSDLDLSNPQAVETLYGRIEKAAQRLCTDSGRRRVDERVKEHQCIARTISDTVGKIPSDPLATLYKQRTTKAG